MGLFLFISFIISLGLLVRNVYYKNLPNINMYSSINTVLFLVMMMYGISSTTTSIFVTLLALIPLWIIYRIFKMPIVLMIVSYISNNRKL